MYQKVIVGIAIVPQCSPSEASSIWEIMRNENLSVEVKEEMIKCRLPGREVRFTFDFAKAPSPDSMFQLVREANESLH